MVTDLIRAYLDARTRLQEATQRVERMVGTITSAAGHLRDWRHVVIGGAGGFALEMAGARDLDVRPQDWPTLQDIRTAMQEWHRVRLDALNAWNRGPPTDRAGLQPPE
jgi:hypothetical protein